MPLSDDLKANYEAVLRDLEADRLDVQQQLTSLGARMRELHASILTLSRKINPGLEPALPNSPATLHPLAPNYAKISVRWAILDLLHGSDGMTTSEVAEALKAAGVQSKAANFVNNVSAVLTGMQRAHSEVLPLPDGRWKLSSTGASAIEYIRTTDKFKRGCVGKSA